MDLLFVLEPRISGQKANNVVKRIKLDGCFRQDSMGFLGGIWMLWDTNVLKVIIEKIHSQFIHAKV